MGVPPPEVTEPLTVSVRELQAQQSIKDSDDVGIRMATEALLVLLFNLHVKELGFANATVLDALQNRKYILYRLIYIYTYLDPDALAFELMADL